MSKKLWTLKHLESLERPGKKHVTCKEPSCLGNKGCQTFKEDALPTVEINIFRIYGDLSKISRSSDFSAERQLRLWPQSCRR